MTKKRYEIKQHKVEKDTGFDVSKTAQLGQILKESYLITYSTIISQNIFYDFNLKVNIYSEKATKYMNFIRRNKKYHMKLQEYKNYNATI